MKRLPFLTVTILLITAGCSTLPSISSTPTPAPSPTPVTFAEDTARAFLKAWSESDYGAMYALLAPSRTETLTAEQFIARYQDIAMEATIKSVKPAFVSSREEGNEAEVKFTVTFETNAVGTIQQENTMPLRRQENRWAVLWTPGLIFTQLRAGGQVRFTPLASARGDIFDRKGRPLTAPLQQVVVEAVPAEMKNESAVLAALAKVFNLM